ncbi:MAG: flagellar biosynthesis protein FlgB [Hyphomonas sp.]|jgi:flagellar basal-body rod protein FlgB|nr:flagellar biosynthesis protein FlgB [Hyphomonas sp.]
MLSDMSLFQIYGAMARHAAETQKTSAGNLARANEPGYKAVEVESFAEFMTRTSHQPGGLDFSQGFDQRLTTGAAAPNGNTVSIEEEVFKSAEAVGKHTMALNVYTKSMDLMKLALGRRT